MKDFKSFDGSAESGRNAAGGAKGKAEENKNTQAGAGDNAKQVIDMATMIAGAMNGKSEGQILQTIIAQAEQGKRDGTLTNADIDNFYNAIAPMLDGFKRQKLKSIVARLKSI